MASTEPSRLREFRQKIEEEYAERFPRSKTFLERHATTVLDHTSHAIRWNDPFMPIVRKAQGPAVEDLDGHRILDYWQGHFGNILGHNPALVRDALADALADGRGLQTGMLHEVEAEVSELICEMTGAETMRLTTSGSLGTFYAVVLARAFTGRDRVLKVSGGWHGSQPFGLKGVSFRDRSFDHLESEGLSASVGAEVVLTRFNDVEDLRRVFADQGDRIACLLVEPLLGAGGGMVGSAEYLREARRLTEKHGALLLCDEIITGFRFHAGDFCSMQGVTPDLLILGKVLGGGMPVAAVAGRREVLDLATRASGRVKFEGGTFSAHELCLIASRAMLIHLQANGDEVYRALAERGRHMRSRVSQVAAEEGVPVCVLGQLPGDKPGSSLVFAHVVRENVSKLASPEDLARAAHPLVNERLVKSLMLLEDVSVRSGIGAVSTAHSIEDLDRSAEALRAVFHRVKTAGLV